MSPPMSKRRKSDDPTGDPTRIPLVAGKSQNRSSGVVGRETLARHRIEDEAGIVDREALYDVERQLQIAPIRVAGKMVHGFLS